MGAKKTKTDELDFEQAMQDLESLVDKMESGDLSLEDSLKHFEQGVHLTRTCQQALKQAEQKVSILMQTEPGAELQDFENTTDTE